jgi:NADP-dependent 3-hydroxy acid dehydrogenase YdfG
MASAIEGRSYVVTGGSGAVATAVKRGFENAGARVFSPTHRDFDLTTVAGAEAMIARAEATLGGVDGLIHTVGGFAMAKVHEASPADYDRMFDLNVRSLFYVARALLPSLLERKRGFLAAFSSEPGWSGAASGASLYAAAKSAVATFMRSLDAELAGTQVRVAIVYPMGAIDTPANRRDMPDFPVEKLIDPSEIAATLVHAAGLSDRARLTELPIWPAR